MGQAAGILSFVLIVAVINLALGYGTGRCARTGNWPRLPNLRRRKPAEVEVTYEEPTATESPSPENVPFPDLPPPKPKPSGELRDTVVKLVTKRHEFHREMVAFAEQLRSTQGQAECARIQELVERRAQVAQQYLEFLNGSMKFLKKMKAPASGLEFAAPMRAVLDSGWQAINETMIKFVGFQCTPENLSDSIARFGLSHDQLLRIAFTMRDSLEPLLAKLVREAVRCTPLELFPDLATSTDSAPADVASAADASPVPPSFPDGLQNRLLFEFALETSRKSTGEGGTLCAGLFDLDQATRLPTEYGWGASERLLSATEDVFKTVHGDTSLVWRLRGQQWAVLFPNVALEAAAEKLERTRQTLEQTRFLLGEREVRVTTSCSLTTVVSEQTADIVLEQLRFALREAKGTGRNRTFIFEEAPKPVVPPACEVEPQTIVVPEN